MKKSVQEEVKKLIKKLNLSCSIKDFGINVDFASLVVDEKLSEDFILEYITYLDFNLVSMYQKLSENFIRKFQNRVNWAFISQFQKLSLSFMIEFRYALYIDRILINKSIHLKIRNKIFLANEKYKEYVRAKDAFDFLEK